MATLLRRVMTRAVTWRPLTVEVRVRIQFIPRMFHDGQNDTGTGFPCQYNYTNPPTVIFVYMFLITDGQTGETGNLPLEICFRLPSRVNLW